MSLISLDGAAPGFLGGRRPSGSLTAARAGVQGAFAVVGYLGKSWHIKFRGEDTLIRDGAGKAIQELDVVIVGASPSISKNYYEKGYTRGDDNAPDCFSLDGQTPDTAAPKKQAKVCATCPQNQWGSQMTPDGKKAKACRDSRRLAIVPLGDIANETMGGPMLLRLPPTTLVNFANYADFLERKGVGDMCWVGTRLTFDPDLAYPRIQFNAISYVTEEQDQAISEVMKSPAIDRLLYNFGPTESAPAAAAEGEIAGTPPSRVVSLPARPRSAVSDPPKEEPEPGPEPKDEPPEEDEPAPEPKVAAKPSPFQAATAPTVSRGATIRRGRVSQQNKLAPAPDDLEDAIDDLLDQPA